MSPKLLTMNQSQVLRLSFYLILNTDSVNTDKIYGSATDVKEHQH